MSEIEVAGELPPEDETRAQRKRRERASKAYRKMLVDRTYLAAVIETYHNDTVSPVLLWLTEEITYLKMWPWQKLWYHTLKLVHWAKKLFEALRKAIYVWKWKRMDKAVTERMAAGETLEADE